MKRHLPPLSIAYSTEHSANRHITAMHGWIIHYLCFNHDRDVFQRDIETRFSIRRSTATGILQLMEKNNLIIREPVAYDKRLKKLIPTKRAIEIHEQLMKTAEHFEAKLIEGITPDELNAFFSIIEKMKHNIE